MCHVSFFIFITNKIFMFMYILHGMFPKTHDILFTDIFYSLIIPTLKFTIIYFIVVVSCAWQLDSFKYIELIYNEYIAVTFLLHVCFQLLEENLFTLGNSLWENWWAKLSPSETYILMDIAKYKQNTTIFFMSSGYSVQMSIYDLHLEGGEIWMKKDTAKALQRGKKIREYNEKPFASQGELSEPLISSSWISRIPNNIKIVSWIFKLLSLWYFNYKIYNICRILFIHYTVIFYMGYIILHFNNRFVTLNLPPNLLSILIS